MNVFNFELFFYLVAFFNNFVQLEIGRIDGEIFCLPVFIVDGFVFLSYQLCHMPNDISKCLMTAEYSVQPPLF